MDPALADESRAEVPIAVVVATLTTATMAVLLRSYTRLVIIKQFGYDDVGAIISLLLAIGCGTAVATNTLYGSGHHIWTLEPPAIMKYFRTFYVSIVLYNASLTAVKFTFLLQYYRVFRVKKMQKIITLAGIPIGCWSLSQLLIVIFNCNPINKFWDPTLPGTCIPNLPFWYINAAGNIVTDVSIFILPLPVLKSLNLERPQKILLMAIFSLGFFTCAISIIRIHYLHLSEDTTWDNVDSACWSITELCSAILCVCLPVLRPLVSRFMPGHGWSTHRKSSHSKDYYEHSPSGHEGSHAYRQSHDVESHDPASHSSGLKFPDRQGVLHTQDLELQRVDSGADLSGQFAALEGTRRSHETGKYSAETGRSSLGAPPKRAPVIPSAKASALLGLQPSASVKTQIKATTPEPEPSSRLPNHGVSVRRDVVIDDS